MHYRCTTCVPEAQVLTNVLTLVQSRVVHPRWLVDPSVVTLGIPLASLGPEDPERLAQLLRGGKVMDCRGIHTLHISADTSVDVDFEHGRASYSAVGLEVETGDGKGMDHINWS